MLSVVVGLLASAISLVLGIQLLDLALTTLLWAVFMSNLAGFTTLLATLTLERQDWVRRRGLLKNSRRTWGFFWVVSLGIFYATNPELWDLRRSGILLLPLIGANGLMIPLFGVVQDGIVRRSQRKARKRPEPATDAPASTLGPLRAIPLFARAAWDAISFKSSN